MKKYIAYNIEWDTDNDKAIFAQLPKEIEIPEEVWKEYEEYQDEDIISDYLSDDTGFCLFGFDLKVVDDEKEEKNMNNITIYDHIQLGDTFHNSNGTDYIILAFDKEADVAILLNPKNGFTPYVGADGLRNNHWCYGHYFKTLQEACDWFNKEIEIGELEEENSDVNIYVGLAFDNDDGELYNTKKSAMEVVGKLVDEIIEKCPDTEISISIDFGDN